VTVTPPGSSGSDRDRAPGRRSPDLVRTSFQLLALVALIASSFLILKPFLAALTWGMAIAVATWPLLLRAQALLGGRRGLAVTLMTAALLLVFVVPVTFAILALVEHAPTIAAWSESVATFRVPPPPASVEALPVVGPSLARQWRQVLAAGPEEIAARLSPYFRIVVLWFVGQVGNVGLLLVNFLLTVAITAILYARGETAAQGIRRFARRLAGTQGENAVHLAAQAIRAVALGVVVTAIVQSALGGIGLAVVGVPFVMILTVVMFILGIAQIGAAPVLIGAVIWVYATSGPVWGTGFLLWAIFCTTIDNFLRPVLIKRGADLPLLLIFAGVIGGLIAFGVIGLFIGPVVLAVAYTLLSAWVSQGIAAADDGTARPGGPTGGG
jgi:predicted PurR-regulated permease PerM